MGDAPGSQDLSRAPVVCPVCHQVHERRVSGRGRCTAPGQTAGTRTIATPAGVVRAAARATAAGLTGAGKPARLWGRVGRRPLLGNAVGYPARTGLCALHKGPSGTRGGLARQAMAGAATGHSAPPPRVPRGNAVATRMRRDYAQFTKARQTAGLLAGMEWPGAAAVPQDAPAPAS
jgi:hypothetical protein